MTTANHNQQDDSINAKYLPADLPDAPSLHVQEYHPDPDFPSDNETSEKPLREKLKKTSLASIPKHNTPGLKFREQEGMVGVIPTEDVATETLENVGTTEDFIEPRGRQMRKRSHDDVEDREGNNDVISSNESSKHRRKELTDMHANTVDMEDHARTRSSEAIVPETEDTAEHERDPSQLGEGRLGILPGSVEGQDVVKNGEDTTFSPRKKRSREHVDAEIDRELKIAATDGARARRSSEERDQAYKSATIKGEGFDKNAQTKDVTRPVGNPDLSITDVTRSKSPPFCNTSTISPFASQASKSSMLQPVSPMKDDSSSREPQTSASAFNASGFAALANSSTSPFATLGSSTGTLGGFGATIKQPNGLASDLSTVPNKNDHHSSTSMIDATSKPSFDAPNVSGFGSFGGSLLGNGFGSALGKGPKLTNFAAPSGDASWGTKSAAIQPFGAAPVDEDEAQDTGDQDENDTGHGTTEAENDEREGTPHQQHRTVDTGEEGEETIFSTRAKLFHWNGKAWVEGGLGIFKLNVSLLSEDSSDSTLKARFIMRAQQTYRVILNTPIFKQMSIGDSRGQEPTSKAISFAVVEKGRPVPYMVRMGNEADVKTLYREVTKLQQQM